MMSAPHRTLRPRLPLRARLTLVYSALFLLAGLVMIAVTWLLVRGQLRGGVPSVVLLGGDGSEPGYAEIVTAVQAEALTAQLVWGVVAVVVVSASAGGIAWLIAGRMLRPLAAITRTARRIADAPDADSRMHERIRMHGPPDEVTELADTFDGMLERLDGAFSAQRRFVANASHELRTPLTLNRALIEVAMGRAGASSDVRVLGEALLRVNARHERLIEGLLLLARSDRGIAEHHLVDLADLAEHVVDQRRAIDPNTIVDVDGDEAPTSGDSVLLEQLVRNLVDNAVEHNLDRDGWTRVRTTTDGGRALIEVENSGPIIAPHELTTITEPFRRLGRERTGSGGAGLGLSIVRAIVDSHAGELLFRAREDGGLLVTVRLPGSAYDCPAPSSAERSR